jgi:hypothetical protein
MGPVDSSFDFEPLADVAAFEHWVAAGKPCLRQICRHDWSDHIPARPWSAIYANACGLLASLIQTTRRCGRRCGANRRQRHHGYPPGLAVWNWAGRECCHAVDPGGRWLCVASSRYLRITAEPCFGALVPTSCRLSHKATQTRMDQIVLGASVLDSRR